MPFRVLAEPTLQTAIVQRGRILLQTGQMGVDLAEQLGISPQTGSKENFERTHQNGGFANRQTVFIGQGIDAIDQTGIRLTAGDRGQHLIRAVQFQIIDLQFEGLGQLKQTVIADIKDTVLHDRHGFAIQVDNGLNGGGRRRNKYLSPVGYHHLPGEGQTLSAFPGDGDSGEQVDLPFLQARQAFGPGSPHEFKLPAFLPGDMLQQFGKNPLYGVRRVLVGENDKGRNGVDARAHDPGFGLTKPEEEQRKSDKEYEAQRFDNHGPQNRSEKGLAPAPGDNFRRRSKE